AVLAFRHRLGKQRLQPLNIVGDRIRGSDLPVIWGEFLHGVTRVRKSEFSRTQIALTSPPTRRMVTLQELLGARIRICIEKAGYRTIEEFAFAFGIGKSTLSDVLNGKKSPTV